jgi:hypothetical protein
MSLYCFGKGPHCDESGVEVGVGVGVGSAAHAKDTHNKAHAKTEKAFTVFDLVANIPARPARKPPSEMTLSPLSLLPFSSDL